MTIENLSHRHDNTNKFADARRLVNSYRNKIDELATHKSMRGSEKSMQTIELESELVEKILALYGIDPRQN